MTTPAPPPNDLATFGAALGIDPSTVAPTAGVKPRPKVLWGVKQTAPLPGLGGDRGVPYKPGSGQGGYSIAAPNTGPVKEYRDVDAARLNVLTWSERELEDFAGRLVAAGLLNEDYTRDEVEAAWGKLVEKAADYAAVGRDVTPFDLVDLYGARPDANRAPKVSTVVNRQSTISTPEQARGLLKGALASQIGRAPTAEELDSFQAQLNQAQRANPYVSTSTTTTDATGHSTVNTINTGGVDETGLAEKFGRSGDLDAEHAAYQAATTYMGALMEAIKSPVG